VSVPLTAFPSNKQLGSLHLHLEVRLLPADLARAAARALMQGGPRGTCAGLTAHAAWLARWQFEPCLVRAPRTWQAWEPADVPQKHSLDADAMQRAAGTLQETPEAQHPPALPDLRPLLPREIPCDRVHMPGAPPPAVKRAPPASSSLLTAVLAS
jgi:hypothetical protein